ITYCSMDEPPSLPQKQQSQVAQAAAHLSGIAEDEDRIAPRPLQWLFLMTLAGIVGAGAGAIGALFRMTLEKLDIIRTAMVHWTHTHVPPEISWLIPVLICAVAAGLACLITELLAPETAGSGIPRVEAVLRNHLRPANLWIVPVKFIGGSLGIGGGLALGREGPTVQMGGAIGRMVSDRCQRFLREPWTLIAAGAGAGLAVAFNAPLAALLFVVEELLHRFSARVFCATLVACITGTVVLRAMMGDINEFAAARLTLLSPIVLPDYLVLGALAGLLGVAFNTCLTRTLSLSDHIAHWPRGAKGAIVGAGTGLLAWFAPQLVGGGELLATTALLTRLAWGTIVGFLAARFLLTITSYSTGSPGGIFAPLLALGSLLGNGFAEVESLLLHHPIDPTPFAVVGMAALFTAVVRSPLTGVVLLLEMSGGWPLILPMMAASIMAYAIPEILQNPAIYDSLRERDEMLERSRRSHTR
ncbi:MAG TPA: H(+)/Cl(-) exchange transporter ClcA, partial [Tepidisphaeraceae bacterium]|nr:H(+)/Cl(-) exchange transporter ClcA [Tepidisphaeraceae bacterium]